MFHALRLIPRNTDEIDDRARPASHQQLKRSDADPVPILRSLNHPLVFFRQRLKIGRHFGHEFSIC